MSSHTLIQSGPSYLIQTLAALLVCCAAARGTYLVKVSADGHAPFIMK